MAKNKLLASLLGLAIVVGLGAGSWFVWFAPSAAPELAASAQQISTSLAISGGGLNYQRNLTVSENTTALAQLQQAAQELGITLATQTSSFGTYVSGIGGVAGDDKNYWAMFVNGAMSQVGADTYQLQPGDAVSWTYTAL